MFHGRGVGATVEASLEAIGSPLLVIDDNGDSVVAVRLEQALGRVVNVVYGIGEIGAAMDGINEVRPRGGRTKFFGESRD